MSVQTWKRKLSSAEYVNQVYQLNVRLGKILVNKPQKYKNNYTDEIIKTGLETLKHVSIADTIYMTQSSSKEDYKIRRKHLLLARGKIKEIATASMIFLEIVRTNDYASEGNTNDRNKMSAKLFNQALEIGDRCDQCIKLISGIIKSDSEIYKKYIKPKA